MLGWARTYDLALGRDGRAADLMLAQISWLAGPANQEQGKYAMVVFSAKTHRRKYDDIVTRIYKLSRGDINPDAAAKAKGDAVRAARERREAAEHAQRQADRDNTASPDEMRAAVKASRERRGEGGLRRVMPEVS